MDKLWTKNGLILSRQTGSLLMQGVFKGIERLLIVQKCFDTHPLVIMMPPIKVSATNISSASHLPFCLSPLSLVWRRQILLSVSNTSQPVCQELYISFSTNTAQILMYMSTKECYESPDSTRSESLGNALADLQHSLKGVQGRDQE